MKEQLHPSAITCSSEGNWGLSFQTDGEPPIANASMEELARFDAYYAQNTTEKSPLLDILMPDFENWKHPP